MTFNLKNLKEDERFALLFGILAGDGCLSKHINKRGTACYFISITGSLIDDLPFFKQVLSPLLEEFRGKNTNIKFRRDCKAIEFNFCDKALFHRIKDAGFPRGKKGQKLIIPNNFYEKNLLKYIIQGFFATDGSLVLTKNPNKFYPRIESIVIHKDFLKQVYDYLISIGLKGAYYKSKSKPDPKWKTFQEKYRFQFNGKKNLLLFDKLVGFVNPKHKRKFIKFIEYDKEYNNRMKDIPFTKPRFLRVSINAKFVSKMAALGVEPRTSCS